MIRGARPVTKTRRSDFPTHHLVAKTAKEMARALYEEWASKSDLFYSEHRSMEEYADEAWPMFVEAARATLAKMLATNLSEELKNQIADALIKDNALRTRRRGKILQIQN